LRHEHVDNDTHQLYIATHKKAEYHSGNDGGAEHHRLGVQGHGKGDGQSPDDNGQQIAVADENVQERVLVHESGPPVLEIKPRAPWQMRAWRSTLA